MKTIKKAQKGITAPKKTPPPPAPSKKFERPADSQPSKEFYPTSGVGTNTIAKNGKWMQKAAASIKKRGTAGKCTPITKPGCTGKAKALAKTFKKIAKSNKKK